jgi:hydroxyacylglutathione hydrolase
MLEITPIQALKDNYIWLIIHRNSKQCMIVDPSESEPIIKELQEKSLQLRGILITHHHWDHTKGIEKILNYQQVPVYGPKQESIQFCSNPLQEGDILKESEDSFTFSILDIPGHTKGHIAYYGSGALFSGDTLFTAGCGRAFEGTMQQLFDSLNKLANLPLGTLIYCGHEYTVKNLLFASQVEPNNRKIQERLLQARQMREQGLPTVPATLALEKKTNPFLRTQEPEVIASAERYMGKKLQQPLEVFTAIRRWKDDF